MLTMRLASTVLGLAALSGLSFPVIPSHAAEVKVEADLGQTVLDTRSSNRIYLRLSLKSDVAKKRDKRSPVNVALVIDRSGSMTGDRIAAAKKGAHVALERLSSDDIVSLVSYNHEVDLLAPAAPVGGSRDKLERAIEKLTADGTTALYAGVKEGGEQVKEFRSDTKVNRVILLSDGLANVGPSSPREVAELGRELASKGISVTTIGLGLEYNEDLMQRLAAASDGNHVFVERPSDLAEIFDREFGDALSIAAQDLTITIECRVGFKPTRVLGREAEISGQRITLKLNQLQADNERYVVVELEAPKGEAAGDRDVAEVGVEYLDLDGNQRKKADANVRVQIKDDAKAAEASINKQVMSQVTEQVATENSEKAVELRDKGDVAGAKKALEENATFLKDQRGVLGSGTAAAAPASVEALKKLEEGSREAANNLDNDNWDKTRKVMRSDQHKSKVQQAY
jgi:Ca-activated chloride channel family protein